MSILYEERVGKDTFLSTSIMPGNSDTLLSSSRDPPNFELAHLQETMKPIEIYGIMKRRAREETIPTLLESPASFSVRLTNSLYYREIFLSTWETASSCLISPAKRIRAYR